MRPIHTFSLLGTLLGALLATSQLMAQDTQRFERHEDGVLGTSLDMTMYGPDLTALEAASTAALAEIARLENIFSTYREDSEVMRLNRERVTESASPELLEVLGYCADWQRISQGRFSCNLGRILAVWDEAEKAQVLPDRAAMRELATAVAAAKVEIDRSKRHVGLPEPVEIEPSGLAKGYIIDKALAVLRKAVPQAIAIKVDIGGDAIYWGRPPLNAGWRVGIANPMDPSDNSGLLTTLSLDGMAIASSGHVSRFRTIGGTRYSHIFNPADGWPVENGIGAITLAPTAVMADAAATAITMQTVAEGATWATSLPELDALAVDAAGNQAASEIWPSYVAEELISEANSVLSLNYTLPIFPGSYNRPYVAIWVSDADQNLLKSLLLLGESERWARENTRWWRRVGRSNPSLLDGIARPTRAPGEYRLTWDGRDDAGNTLPPGNYLMHLEAARQNGGSSYQRVPFTLGTDQSVEIPPDGELGRIQLKVGPPE